MGLPAGRCNSSALAPAGMCRAPGTRCSRLSYGAEDMSNPADPATLATRAAAALAITAESAAKELDAARDKLARGLKKLAQTPENDLAIATVPRDEIWREDMVTLYRCKPVVERRHGIPILITYA